MTGGWGVHRNAFEQACWQKSYSTFARWAAPKEGAVASVRYLFLHSCSQAQCPISQSDEESPLLRGSSGADGLPGFWGDSGEPGTPISSVGRERSEGTSTDL